MQRVIDTDRNMMAFRNVSAEGENDGSGRPKRCQDIVAMVATCLPSKYGVVFSFLAAARYSG